MQFKNIGDFLKIANSSKSFLDFSNLAKSIGDVDKVADALKNVKNISDDVKIGILSSMDGVNKSMAETALGIKAVGTASATATSGVTGLGTAIKGAIVAHPFLATVTAITAVVGAFVTAKNAYDEYNKKQLESAQAIADTADKNFTTLSEQKDRIIELKTALEEGTLSEEEAYSAKSELFNIQQQLIGQYGSMAGGIDLVNGKLENQIGIIKTLSQEEANKKWNEIDMEYGVDKIKSAMEEETSYQIGLIPEAYKDSVEKVLSDFDLEFQNDTNGNYIIKFTGDAREAEETLNNIRTKITDLTDEDLINEDFYADQIQEWFFNDGFGYADIDSSIASVNELTTSYGDLYDTLVRLELMKDKTAIETPYETDVTKQSKSISEVYDDYTKAVKEFNEAVISGDDLRIEKSRTQLEGVQDAIENFLSVEGNEGYRNLFETIASGLNESALAALNFKNAVNGVDIKGAIKDADGRLNRYTKQLKGRNLTDIDFMNAALTEGNQSGETAVQRVISASIDLGFISDRSKEEIQKLCDILVELGVISTGTASDITEVTKSTSDLSSILSGENEELSNTLSSYKTEMETLTTAKATLDKNGGILDDKQIAELLESCPKLANYMDDLEGGVDTLLKTANNDILETFTEEIEALREAGKNTEADALQAYVNSVMEAANEIEETFIKIGNLKVKTPQFEKLEEASSGEKPGDMSTSLISSYKTAQEAYEKGEYGDPVFKAFAEMISPTGSSDANNYAENIGKFERYFTDSAEGCENFLTDLERLGYASKEGNKWTYDLGSSMEDLQAVADKAGIGFEVFMAKFDELEKYGFTNDFFVTEEDGIEHVNSLYQQLANEKRRLAEIEANPNTEGYSTAVEEAKNNIAELEERIQSSKESINEIIRNEPENIAERASYAKDVISSLQEEISNTDDQQYKDYLQSELDAFAKEYNMVLDINGNYVSLEEELSNLDFDVALNAKGEDLDNEISRLSQHLAELREEDGINLDTEQISSAETLLSYLVTRKQELTAPAVMNISTEQLSNVDDSLSSAITAIQNFQTAYNELEQAKTLGLDTTEAQTAVDEAKATLAEIDDETQKTLNFDITGLDDAGIIESIANLDLSEFEGINQLKYEFNITNLEDLENAILTIEKLPKDTQTVSVSINQGDGYTVEELGNLYTSLENVKASNPETTVIVNGVQSSSSDLQNLNKLLTVVDNNNPAPIATLQDRVSSVADEISRNLSNLNGKRVTTYIDVVKSESSTGGDFVNGNAHAHGTPIIKGATFNDGYVGRHLGNAYAQGTWGEKRNTKALTGELGQELIVRGNHFFTVGDNGAEMVNLKKGDIVFNHRQTKDILTKGYTTGRGRALATGNARNTGGGTLPSSISSSAPSTKSIASSVQKAVSTAAKSLTKTAKSIANWAKDLFDHIEIKLDNLEKKASSYYDKAQLYIDKGLASASNYKNAEKNLQNAINTVNEQINYNKQGEVRYALQAEAAYQQALKKLNSKNDKTFKSAVSTIKSGGTIDISSYNEKVREAIEEFQKWYDKSQDCKYAIDDLNATLEEYSDELYNLPLEQASAKIEKLSASMDVLNSKTSVATTGGSSIENFADVLDANVSSAQSSLKSANSNVSSKQTAYNKAKSAYNSAVAKENETEATLKSATKTVKKYGGKLGKKRLKQIANGEIISTKGLKGKALTAAKAYNKAVQANDKAEAVTASAKTAYTNATNALNNAKTAKAQIDAYYNELKKQQEEIRKYENKASYEYANYLAKQGLNNTAQQHQANLSALSQAEANVTTASNTQKSTANAVTSKANSILNSKYASKLTTAQKNALKAGKSVSTSGVTNKTLLKYLNDYNAKVQAATSAANNLTNAQEALITAQQNATTSAAELASARTEYAKQTFENIQNYYNAVSDYRKTLADQYSTDRSLKEAYGKDLNTSDFQNEIGQLQSQRSLLVEERSKLESQLNSLVSQGYIKQNTEEWYEMKSQIVEIGNEIDNLDMSVMELQDTMREEVFYQALNKALETAEKLRGSISTIKDIISDEMMFDDDGKLTDFGITALAMDIKEYESNIDSLGTLLKKRDQYIKDFNNGNNSTNYSQKEFNEDMDTITSEIQNMLKDTNSVRQAIIDTIVKQGEVELEAVDKVIDAREKLLQKQKDYYDYDKTLKSQTKDLKLLEQQISALDGMTDAESRAQKARLEAQRQEKQDELDETVRDHVFDLQVQGLDDLKVELQENYDNYVKDLNNNLDTIVSTVKNTTASINGTLNTVNATVKKILNSYGVSGLDITDIGLPKYASGTKYVKKSGWTITQEKGGELILKDGSVLTPLKAGDGVIPNKLTEDLFDLASNYDKIMDNIQQPRIYCPEVIVPDLKGNRQTISPTVECPINIYGNNINEQDVVKAIRKSIPEISKTVQNDIRKDLKKSGR